MGRSDYPDARAKPCRAAAGDALLADGGFILRSRAVAAAAAINRHLCIADTPGAQPQRTGRGPQQAAALGVDVRPLEWGIYIAASLLTATAVTTAGSIGLWG